MYQYQSALEERDHLLGRFNEFVKDIGLRSIKPLDVNVEFRIVSFEMNKNRLGRMYLRYGVFMLYKYNDDFTNLLDYRCYRLIDKGQLLRCQGYENYFRTLLLCVFPEIFRKYNKAYKVKLINSHPPYEDESFETLNQEVVFDVGFVEGPLTPIYGLFVLEIDGVELVGKVSKRSMLQFTSLKSYDFCNMPSLQRVHPNVVLQVVVKNDFLSGKIKWLGLEQYLHVLHRESRPYDIKMYVEFDLNDFSKCEDIHDEDIYEMIDGECYKTF